MDKPKLETRNAKPSDTTRQASEMTPRQVALNNLKRLEEASERFGEAVKSGKIAPPTSAGRWK